MPDTDPQAPLLDRLTPEQTLDVLGPSWADLTHQALPPDVVGDLIRRCDVGNLEHEMQEILARIEKRFARIGRFGV